MFREMKDWLLQQDEYSDLIQTAKNYITEDAVWQTLIRDSDTVELNDADL